MSKLTFADNTFTCGRSRAGFTLIEIILVMAISSALAVMAMAGFSALRGQAQFSQSVERFKETVLAKRTEALTTVKSSGGTDVNNVTFGRILTFTPGSGVVQVQTLMTANDEAPSAGQAVSVVANETQSITMDWGMTFSGAQRAQVAFTRSATDGGLQTSANTSGGWSAPYHYGDFVPGAAAVNIELQDPSGRGAYLTIDPTNNSISRTFR